ncbi:diacylglycerol kinase family protein [Streptomyces capparidis]
MSAQPPSGHLLLVIDPAARATDGESVRVAKDVLCAGAQVKIVIPESVEELSRVLAHRGRRRPVVVGDDRALHRVVHLLHERRELGAGALGHVPVGPPECVPMARALGLPTSPAAAARAVLSGAERHLDLLVDDRGGVVLGSLQIRSGAQGGPRLDASLDGLGAAGGPALWSSARSFVRGLRVPLPGGHLPPLRVEADGVLLADLDRPVQLVAVSNACPPDGEADAPAPADGAPGHPDDGLVEVTVRQPAGQGTVRRMCARAVTVTGRGFTYAADALVTGPVRTRTWTVLPRAWRLTVPAQDGGETARPAAAGADPC